MSDIDSLLDRAWAAYANHATSDALALAERAVALADNDGPSWFCLACCHERAGHEELAAAAFARAADAPVDPQPLPCAIDAEHFRELAEQVLLDLPPDLAPAVDSIDLVILDYCPPGLIQEDEAEILGLYDGPTLAELNSEWDVPQISPCLYLFRRAHEHACIDLDEMHEQCRITVLHELGHHLGFDEDDLDALGLG